MRKIYETQEELIDAVKSWMQKMVRIHCINVSIWNGYNYRRMVVVEILHKERPVYDGDSYSATVAEIADVRFDNISELRGYARYAFETIAEAFPESTVNLDLTGGDMTDMDEERNEIRDYF